MARLKNGNIWLQHNTELLSNTKTLTNTDKQYQFLDPNGADRVILLPVASSAGGLEFTIANTAVLNNLIITYNSNIITTINPGTVSKFICNNSIWTAQTSSEGSGLTYSIISTNTIAVKNHGYLIDASSTNITLTLPTSPTAGDTIGVVDAYNKATTNIITIDKNNNKIESLSENLILDINGSGFIFVYVDSTIGWKIVSEIGSYKPVNTDSLVWSVITDDIIAAPSKGYLVNATSNDITILLPISPVTGDAIGICDVYGKALTHTITIAGNTHKIKGVLEDLVIDIVGSGFVIVYVDSTRGWEIVSETGLTTETLLTTSITHDDTNHAPNSNAVFDALALKADLISPSFTTPILGTPTSGNLANCTFPTLNQSTSGTAANLSGTPTLPTGTTLVAPVLGTPASGTLDNCVSNTEVDNNSTTQLATTAYAKTQDAVLARLPNQAVSMTYAASGSSGIAVADNDNIDFGTGNFTLVWRGSLLDWAPTQTLYYKGDMAISNFFLGVAAISKLKIIRGDSATIVTSTNTYALTAGTTHEIVAVLRGEFVDFYIDGILFETLACTSSSVSGTKNLYISGLHSSRTAGTCSFAATYNRALTAAEVLDLYRNGISYSDKWGSQTSLITGNDSTFAGASNWLQGTMNAFNATTDLTITANAVNQYCRLPAANAPMVFGKKYRLTFDLANVVGTWGVSDYVGNLVISAGVTTNGTGKVYEFINDQVTVTGGIMLYALSSNSYGDFDNFSLVEIGATLALEPEGIQNNLWYDSSSNALNATYPATGWSLTRKQLKGTFAPPIYTDGTNVGIGTTSPTSKLDVNGTLKTQGTSLNSSIELLSSWANITYDTFTTSGKNVTSAIEATGDSRANSNLFTLIVGNIYKLTSTLTLNTGGAPILYWNGATLFQSLVNGVNTHIFIATTQSYITLYSVGATNYSVTFTLIDNNALTVIGNSYMSDNVGIGTMYPTSRLDVSSTNLGPPNSSGSTNLSLMRIGYFDHTWGGGEINFGVINGGYYPGWIQVQACSDYATRRPLLLNPIGGSVGIATTTPAQPLHVVGITRISTLAGTGTRAVYSTLDGDLTNTASDRALKKAVETIPYGIEEVLSLNPIRFEWTQPSLLGEQKEIGFIAQEVEEVIPEIVGMNYDGMKSLDYAKLTSVLCKAIQDQQVLITNQQNIINNLITRITALEALNV